MIWSVSAQRMWQRCQQEFYFATLMAHPRANDPVRRRAHQYKQAQHMSQWIGSVVHHAIEHWVIPKIQRGTWPSTPQIVAQAQSLAQRQFVFSASEQFRHVSKNNAADAFCMLAPHLLGEAIAPDTLDVACDTITTALHNLLESRRIRQFLIGRQWYRQEWMLSSHVDGITVRAKPDLLMLSATGRGLDVVDWKVATTSSNYHYQVAVYAHTSLHSSSLGQFAEDGLTGYVVNLLAPDPAVALDHPYVVDEDAIAATENAVYESIEEVRSLTGNRPYAQQDMTRFEYAKSAGTCAICNFRPLCMELSNDSPAKSLSNREPTSTQLALPLD